MNNKQKQHLKPEDKEMENMKDMNETMVNELNPEMLEKVAGGKKKKKSKKTETGEARR